MNFKKELILNTNNKKIVIGVIGLGYVGLPLSILFAKKNFRVLGFDIDKKKIKKLKSQKSYIDRIKNSEIKILSKKSKFYSSYKNISSCNVIIICVPTPLTKNNKPDLSQINNSIKRIKPYLQKGQIIVLESTSYPGTTRELIVDKLKYKFKIGKDFFVGFSSERIDPGWNEKFFHKIPKVVSGLTKNCLEIIINLYSKAFIKIVKSKSLEIAEFSKLLENIYRSVNIGLINEMKIIAERMNVDIFEIIKVAKTKPFGFIPFHPGPGVGGHCIPIDPYYLYWKAKKFNYEAKFIKLSSDTNLKMKTFIKKKIFKLLNSDKIPLINSRILILGISYKKNLDDIRESPSVELIKYLIKRNIKKVEFSDPHIDFLKISSINYRKKSIFLSPQNLSKFDMVVLMTDHDKFNFNKIYKYSKKIIDCRGKYPVDHKVYRA